MKKDVAVIGGGIGGCLAALTAAKSGKHVVLTEETAWIGGQLTSQAVPPDEHPWIEQFGATRTYRRFRNEVRNYYRRNYPLIEEQRKNEFLNPGNAWVSRLAHEPFVALKILYELLQPYLSNGRIQLLLHTKIKRAKVENAIIQKLFLVNQRTGEEISIQAQYVIDGTELGDVLPIVGAAYTTGAESIHETKEPHALQEKQPQDMQPITHVFAVEFAHGEDHTIEKPEMYEEWKNFTSLFPDYHLLSDQIPDAQMNQPRKMPIFTNESGLGLWEYRRMIDRKQFEPGFYKGDLSLINWPQNDYWLGSIIDVEESKKQRHLYEARQLSLSLLYWLQTEAPRGNGQVGYPELKLRPDIVGTKDGLAMHPYIRESRRIKAFQTVTEHDIHAEIRGNQGIKKVAHSVGIGAYRMDLHPTTITNRFLYAKTFPFEIPLGCFIPVKIKNLIPACKNIGTTQLTNGCFRVHPVEWNIGEVAGALASLLVDYQVYVQHIYENQTLIRELQNHLSQLGVPLHWPEIGAI